MDESPTVWGINPKFLFQTVNSGGRAAAPESDERARITTNVCVSADGSSDPPSFIIKCSTESLDQSRVQVINALFADPEFNTDGKWTKNMWRRKDVRQDEGKINEERFKGSANRMLIFLSCSAVFWVTQAPRRVKWSKKHILVSSYVTLTVALFGLTRQHTKTLLGLPCGATSSWDQLVSRVVDVGGYLCGTLLKRTPLTVSSVFLMNGAFLFAFFRKA